MPRFEYGEHPQRKFWEITLKGSIISTAVGKVGMTTSRMDGKTFHHSGPTKQSDRELKTIEAARRTYDRMIAEKLAAGYQCVDGAMTPSADTPVHRNAALEAALLEDTAPFLVYSDWLQERGDPRGELIALHHAMQGHHDSTRFLSLRQQERALHQAHDRAWLGPHLVDAHYRTRFDWRLGFVDVARLDARCFASETRLPVLTAELLASPAGCAVRRLILRTTSTSQHGPPRVSNEMLVEEIVDTLALVEAPSVRAIEVQSHSWREPGGLDAIREHAARTLHRLASAGVTVAFSVWNE
jgi:uncharacterized protein (TIGR02996 family)